MCLARTKNGQCKRSAVGNTSFCRQHQGRDKAVEEARRESRLAYIAETIKRDPFRRNR